LGLSGSSPGGVTVSIGVGTTLAEACGDTGGTGGAVGVTDGRSGSSPGGVRVGMTVVVGVGVGVEVANEIAFLPALIATTKPAENVIGTSAAASKVFRDI
jgi:hypothetical protein